MRGHGRGYGRVLLGGDVEMGMGMVCWALGGRATVVIVAGVVEADSALVAAAV